MENYFYEIIEDYKAAATVEEKQEIFRDFCTSIWSSPNKRRVYTKVIRFRVKKDLLTTDLGQVFHTWSEMEYQGYKSLTREKDYASLIRQKINNLYTNYFDREVIVHPEYINLLKKPKQLYLNWIDGLNIDAAQATLIIDQAVAQSISLKARLQKEKMNLSWSDYKDVIEIFLKRAFENCKLIDDYENKKLAASHLDFLTEDNFYIKYFCKCLDGEMKKWQKKYYGVREHKKYRRCIDCGTIYEIKTKDTNSHRCHNCKCKHKKLLTLYRVRKYRENICNASKN